MARQRPSYKLSTRNVRLKLKPRQEPYWQPISTGKAIGYRLSGNGSTWFAKFINDENKRFKQTLGVPDDYMDADGKDVMTYAEAQEAARLWFIEMEQNPTGGKPRRYTVNDALNSYVVYLREEKAASTYRDAVGRINGKMRPQLGNIKLSRLTAKRILEWRSGLLTDSTDSEDIRKSKDTANRLLTYLKAALNRAFVLNMVANNTEWKKIKPYKDVGRPRSVYLTEQQCRVLVENCSVPFKYLVEAAIHTGCRFGELIKAKVGDFDNEKALITVTGKTGNRNVYLSEEGLLFLQTQTSEKSDDDFIFQKNDGNSWGKSHQHRHIKKAVDVAGLPPETCFYSLRHAHVSLALLKGINVHILAKNLGNSASIIERNYAKFIESDRRAAIAKSAPSLMDKSGNVLSFAKNK